MHRHPAIRFAHRCALALAALLLGAAPARPAGDGPGGARLRQDAGQEPAVRVLRAGTLIVDPRAAPIADGVVVIEEGRIVAAGPADEVRVPEDAEVLDLGDLTVLPGLIDAHTHLATSEMFEAGRRPSVPLAAIRAVRGMRRAVEAGVTTLRVVGSDAFIDVALRDAIEEGVIVGPRVVPAGHAIGIPGGHTDFLALPPELWIDGLYTPLRGFVSSPADAERAVQLQLKYGAEVIKVTASGGVGSPLDAPDQEQLSEEELRVVADMAHRMGRKATAHAENAASVKAAVWAGFDSVDHGSELDDEAIALMLERGTCLIPTLYVVEFIDERGEELEMPEYVLRKGRRLAETHFPSFRRALEAGVRIAAGSDMNYAPGRGTLIDELEALVRHGMTPRQALVAATVGAAECLGLGDEIGTLEAGKGADLIGVRGDPLEDVAALEQVELVVRGGEVLVSRLADVRSAARRRSAATPPGRPPRP